MINDLSEPYLLALRTCLEDPCLLNFPDSFCTSILRFTFSLLICLKHVKIVLFVGEDEETEGEADDVVPDLIDDNPIEEDSDGDDSDDEGPATKRNKVDEDDDDDDVDDDDLALIAENTGIKLKKKKASRVKILDDESDEEEEEQDDR